VSPKKHKGSDPQKAIPVDQMSTSVSSSRSPSPDLKRKKSPNSPPLKRPPPRIRKPTNKVLENSAVGAIPKPAKPKQPKPPSPKAPPPFLPIQDQPPNPPPAPPRPPAAPKKAPGQNVVLGPQTFPELDEILDATTKLPLPIRIIPHGVLWELRGTHAEILAKATTPGGDRGLGIRQLLTFFRLVLTPTEYRRAPEARIREKLRLWKLKQFQTLLGQLRLANDDMPAERRQRPLQRASTQGKRELALAYIQAGRPSKVLDLVLPARFGGRGDIKEDDMKDYFPQAADNMNDVEPPEML
jgi:hypothetical protein